MSKEKVAISACLTGCSCRYDANDNLNETLLSQLESYETIPFCPEEECFGTPRPTMDLIDNEKSIEAISNESSKVLSLPIINYAKTFFKNNPNIKLFIGKDRSPSCAVKSAKVYDVDKNLLHKNGIGLMSEVALGFGIECWDAEVYVDKHRGIVPTEF